MQAPPAVDLIGLEPRHIPGAHRLSAQENWPHRPEDWAFMLDLSHGFAGVADGEVVGTAMFTPYGATAGTCNMIIVDPGTRGTGLGRRLMQATLDTAGDRETRLVATEAGRPLYEKLGFVRTGAIRQYQGVAAAADVPDSVVVADAGDLDTLAALDLSAIGMDRRRLLTALLRDGTVLLLRKSGEMAGYVAIRRFGRGEQIGPLVARDDSSATTLLQAGLARCAGGFARFDLTDAAAGPLDAIVAASGLDCVNTVVAMTRPGAHPSATTGAAQIYALASQALG